MTKVGGSHLLGTTTGVSWTIGWTLSGLQHTAASTQSRRENAGFAPLLRTQRAPGSAPAASSAYCVMAGAASEADKGDLESPGAVARDELGFAFCPVRPTVLLSRSQRIEAVRTCVPRDRSTERALL